MRIGIVRYWADRPVAEHEVIARLRGAAEARGHELVELNPDGSALRDAATRPQLDLVLNLHYLSPKALDVPHVGLLWNPIEFYHNFGFVPHFAHQVSHDYLATAGAKSVEAAFAPFRPDLFAEPLPLVNHTVPKRYLAPQRRTDRKLFYVGVNWERVIGIGGRHSDLLGRLDDAGMSEIYGPRKIESFVPWEGYQTYRGDLPFDGWSVIEAISRAGSALVASSPAHYRDGVMSCRPFEAAAAGVPLISERHPFMLEHFADAALFFDERATIADQATEIMALIRRLNGDPDLALELAARAQGILEQRFDLENQLDGLCRWVAERECVRVLPSRVEATALVVPVVEPDELHTWLTSNASTLERFDEVVLVPPTRDQVWADMLAAAGVKARLEVVTRHDTGWSERAAQAAATVDGPVCFLSGLEELFSSYPDVVGRAAQAAPRLVPAVMVPTTNGVDANDRYPRLLSVTVGDWWGVPVAGVVTTGEHLRQLSDLLGPGSHLGVLAELALACDEVGPDAFVPVLRVVERPDGTRGWDVGTVSGAERHRDAQYARALPSTLTGALPPGLLVRETGSAPMGLSTRLAGALRRTALPKPVSEAIITVARLALKPRRTPK
jgi:hypothetical protein